MEVKDLMIGDWVQNPLGARGWVKNIRLFPIESDKYGGYYVIDIAYSQDGSSFASLPDKDIKPIPLTPEILEKNGIKWFCTEPSGRKTYCCNEPVVQCTYIPNSGWLINVGACGSIKVRFVEISKIQYVHELQHALKLCGIEKEIVL